MYVCMYVGTHACTHVCVCMYMYVCTYVFMYVCMLDARIRVCVYVCMYVYLKQFSEFHNLEHAGGSRYVHAITKFILANRKAAAWSERNISDI
jgi:hypothetical protein